MRIGGCRSAKFRVPIKLSERFLINSIYCACLTGLLHLNTYDCLLIAGEQTLRYFEATVLLADRATAGENGHTVRYGLDFSLF